MSMLKSPSCVKGMARFSRHMFASSPGSEKVTYHISIIDYLQNWNFNKKSENFAKSTFMGKNSK